MEESGKNRVEAQHMEHEAGLCVERLEPGEFETAAGVLASAFADDPFLLWAMPRSSSGLADATAFFTFLLRRSTGGSTGVFATSDRSAVAVLTEVGEGRREGPAMESLSPAGSYRRWIERFAPTMRHRYLEYIGISPSLSSRGRGSFLLGTLVETACRQGLPLWCWSSNPRNLSFYRRLGFQAGEELRRDETTPAVTPLLHLP